jgi:hypothetical protein
MQCNCGGEMSSSEHKVSTEATANEWTKGLGVYPIKVSQIRCSGCGRMQVKILDEAGRVVVHRG